MSIFPGQQYLPLSVIHSDFTSDFTITPERFPGLRFARYCRCSVTSEQKIKYDWTKQLLNGPFDMNPFEKYSILAVWNAVAVYFGVFRIILGTCDKMFGVTKLCNITILFNVTCRCILELLFVQRILLWRVLNWCVFITGII